MKGAETFNVSVLSHNQFVPRVRVKVRARAKTRAGVRVSRHNYFVLCHLNLSLI